MARSRRTIKSIFLHWTHSNKPVPSRPARRFITNTRICQCEIVNGIEIIRLFFEERFQFATRLLLAFISYWQE